VRLVVFERRRTDWFGESERGGQGLGRRSVQGTLVSALGRSANILLQLASLILLSRLLTPADFGLFAMAFAIVGFAGVWQDLGLAGATVRSPRITHEQVSKLFWINASAGAAMAALVAVAAPLLQRLYGDERLGPLCDVLALGVALAGLGTQHGALLRRRMRYLQLSRLALEATAMSVGVSVLVAYRGGGYWSLVAGSLAGTATGLVLSWHFCDWRPGPPKAGVQTGAMTRYGLHLAAFGALGYIAGNLANVIIGRAWGPAVTGLYSRAHALGVRLRGYITEPLHLVVPPALARLVPEAAKYADYYYTTCTLAVMAAMPVAFVCFVLPREFIAVLLGPQWQGTGDLLQILSVGIIPQVLLATAGWVYLSAGNSARMLQWGVLAWSLTIAAIVLGSRYRLLGIALASSLVSLALLVPGLVLAFDGTPLRLRALLRRIGPVVAAGGVAGAGAWLVLDHLAAPPPVRLAVGTAVFAAADFLLLVTVAGQRRLIEQVLAHARLRLRRGEPVVQPDAPDTNQASKRV
jgi:PST family polysaccharide transporter